jgi:hypothetical protein
MRTCEAGLRARLRPIIPLAAAVFIYIECGGTKEDRWIIFDFL